MKNIKAFLLILFISLSFCSSSMAQRSMEYYQSLFLLKFLKYTEYQQSNNYYTIGVVGNSSIISHLATMTKNKKIKGKRVILNKISSYSNINQYSLIYVPQNENRKLDYIISLTKNASIIIVTENKKNISSGACISFYTKQNTLKFAINTTTMAQRKIKISRRLIAVAEVYE